MFAMSRTVGWVSQWSEMLQQDQMRIGRPRQLYLGVQQREYVPRDYSVKTPGRQVLSAPSFSRNTASKEQRRLGSQFTKKVADTYTRGGQEKESEKKEDK
eukprot:NODE_5506_length_576_cov_209.028791.p2 GENE.NODE_5506_length_576_cov_209.028791~~NODE_5506_length_576_cov_209.028791.p2  ORF type:complete len:111 (+),score=32.15 NODE_5506_length_576_cov_209.028791:35-334(+)